ncbi:Na(+)/H(+) antiporter subunit B [Synechococcus elongatus]|uniref:Multicomponent Na+:H+ antiporter subunit B n=2 Tax=Synechococcus elongatus TaxID=32046 RepID=Q31N71_SYNE7|nr:Na(+)/H(+) antiporter subunit B [Synechococcus elongatus]ABB57498.1 putative multicomponent Na+:H+ antiporter subunit B [Synechococcus elongatus PCC 7942 = FACHB-805]AJD57847.1 monovalent cation/H+ antiporter subunit B [Synechococcus elongatus UTEX 2973]MBD2588301.1 Na(+)/H(+) antiporter subunit B [Synechococcus elongatus FACHB-242]MBD2689536.1 Na(+)/H(+) antiporter subunit B [Synechococcus elongatus FACHB-1061]MBD2708045.1 Na(+)/H(+) antiporter subunit B [Synechococcus elongatus PCC 7942 =
MKWIYLAAGLLFFFKIILLPNPTSQQSFPIVELIVQDTGVINAVSGVIFRNRLYDTVFEVVVFTIAIMGVRYLLANEPLSTKIDQFSDPPSRLLAQLGATIAAIVGIELAIRGHLSPGGGFAAGVAGGTAIGLIAMTSSPEAMQSIYHRWHAETWEKVTVLIFIVLSVLTLSGIELPQGQLGAPLSGGIIPILNILVAIKVALGAWAAVLSFIRYRGLL